MKIQSNTSLLLFFNFFRQIYGYPYEPTNLIYELNKDAERDDRSATFDVTLVVGIPTPTVWQLAYNFQLPPFTSSQFCAIAQNSSYVLGSSPLTTRMDHCHPPAHSQYTGFNAGSPSFTRRFPSSPCQRAGPNHTGWPLSTLTIFVRAIPFLRQNRRTGSGSRSTSGILRTLLGVIRYAQPLFMGQAPITRPVELNSTITPLRGSGSGRITVLVPLSPSLITRGAPSSNSSKLLSTNVAMAASFLPTLGGLLKLFFHSCGRRHSGHSCAQLSRFQTTTIVIWYHFGK